MTPIDQEIASVTRRAIVQYSGVVQDFNPVHYDDEFARKSGLPGAIAQGPLTVTLVLDALIAQHGADQIGKLSVRLKAPVLPGDQLHLVCDEQGKLSTRVGEREVLAGSFSVKE
jgi:acyl dehydratase